MALDRLSICNVNKVFSYVFIFAVKKVICMYEYEYWYQCLLNGRAICLEFEVLKLYI